MDKSLAREILRSRISEFEGLRSGVKVISDMPYNAFGEMWIKQVKARLSPETFKSYNTSVNELGKYLNGRGLSRLSDIDKGVVDDFITERRTDQRDKKTGKLIRKANKATTCNNYYKNLHVQFEFAVERKLMLTNPLPPKYNKVPVTDVKEKKALSKEEYQRVMATIKKRYRFYYPIFYVYFHTGLRFSELINQEWQDILWEHSAMRVTKPKGVKNLDNYPPLPIHSGVMETLMALPKKHPQYIFTDEGGRPFGRRTRKFIRRLQKIAADLGIDDVDLHTTRHTHCSQLFDKGLSMPEVQSQMRHTEMRTTQKYAHIYRPQLSKKIEKLKSLDR